MALDFPDTPQDGDTFGEFTYDATRQAWRTVRSGARIVASATAPTSPINGDMWLYTEDGAVFTYLDGAWIEVGNSTASLSDADEARIAQAEADIDQLQADLQNINVYDSGTSSTGYFSLPKGTDEQRPENPSNGDIRFNTESGYPEWYSEAESSWLLFNETISNDFSLDYLIIAGGGGGGSSYGSYEEGGGGGGAGGYRSSVAGENSGQLSTAESPLLISTGTLYSISVGAGGAAASSENTYGSGGEASSFSSIISIGGGGGAPRESVGQDGGSGGGGGSNSGSAGGNGTTNQGFGGGAGYNGSFAGAGGGGGAGGPGGVAITPEAGQNVGGAGISSSITGTNIVRAGGGGGGSNSGTVAIGGSGGGGNGAVNTTNISATAGATNKGSGGGGGMITPENHPPGSGGSGVVILRYPDTISIEASPGLVSSTSIVGDKKVTTFTAGTGSVIFS